MCSGEKISDTEYTVTIYEAQNGTWLFFDDVDIVPVGEATLDIVDGNNITFEYDIDAGSLVKGEGTFNLIRLF